MLNIEKETQEIIIKKLTQEDMLNDFWNVHLKALTSAKINIIIYENIIARKGENEMVGERQVIVGNSQDGRPILNKMKIKAKEALLDEKTLEEKQQTILDAIEKLRK